MQKKVVAIICAVVVLIAAVTIGSFLFATRDMEGNDPSESFSIMGTWQVISHNPDPTNPDSPFVLVEKQYIGIDETSVRYYKDGACVLTADYTFSDSCLKLSNVETSLEGFPAEFVVEQISDSGDYIKLIDEVDIRDWQLIRNAGTAEAPSVVDPASIEGKWNVVMHGTTKVTDEQIVFDTANKTMTDHRPSGERTVPYTWLTEGRVEFAGFGEFVLCNVSETCLVMIQLNDNGNVWELHRAS